MPAAGPSWQLLLPILAAVCSAGQSSELYPVCDIQCCQALPDCTAATILTCACHGQREMILGKGDIPPSVQKVAIAGASSVVILEDAISDLLDLQFLGFSDIDSIEIQSDGLRTQAAARLFALILKNVGTAKLQASSFSGSWESGATIRMQNINRLHVRSGAFRYKSTANWPSISLEEIRTLSLESRGFSSPFSEVNVLATKMETCEKDSFTDKIGRIDLQQVIIEESKGGCIRVSNTDALSLRSCEIHIVRPSAFTGQMHSVIIEDTNLTIVHEKGFQIQTHDFRIEDSQIRDLGSKGFDVTATHNIFMTRVTIEMLHENALFGLRAESDRSSKLVTIRSLKVYHAENGSFRLWRRADFRVYDLNVDPPRPPVCPIVRWVRQLVGRDAATRLGRTGTMVLRQLSRHQLCESPRNEMSPDKSSPTQTPQETVTTKHPGYKVTTDSGVHSTVVRTLDVVSIGAVFGLLAAILVSIVIVTGLLLRWWKAEPRPNSSRNNYATSDPASSQEEPSPPVDYRLAMPLFAEGDGVPQVRHRNVPGGSTRAGRRQHTELPPTQTRSVRQVLDGH